MTSNGPVLVVSWRLSIDDIAVEDLGIRRVLVGRGNLQDRSIPGAQRHEDAGMAGRLIVERIEPDPTLEMELIVEHNADPIQIEASWRVSGDESGRGDAQAVSIDDQVAPLERQPAMGGV